MVDVPSLVRYGQVVGRFVRFVANLGVGDAVPDEQPLSGTITLTPLTKVIRYLGTSPPRLAVAEPVVCSLDADGDLIGPNGEDSVYVIATDQPDGQPNLVQWRASFAFAYVSVQPAPVTFNVPADDVIDLATVALVPAAPPQVIVVDGRTALSAQQAAQQAEQASQQASDAVDYLNAQLAAPPPLEGRLAVAGTASINLSADGSGTPSDPMTITGQMIPGTILDRLQVADSASLDLTLAGAGTTTDPAVLSGQMIPGTILDRLHVADSASLDLTLAGTGTPGDPAVLSGQAMVVPTAVVHSGLGWVIGTDPVYGVDPTGATDSTAAIQAGADAAVAANSVYYLPPGNYLFSSTLTFRGSFDLRRATFNYAPPGAGGVALQIGDPTTMLFRAVCWLPAVINTKKASLGWGAAGVAGSVGVQVMNCYACSITIPWVRNFEIGTNITGLTNSLGNGTQYCSLYPLHLDNNKINFAYSPVNGVGASDSGRVISNTVIGGRMSHDAAEGSQVAGTRHVVISNGVFYSVNGCSFLGTGLESPDVVEYHVECFGSYNVFDNCRWDNSVLAHIRVWCRGTGQNNWVRGGSSASSIVYVKDSGSFQFRRLDNGQFFTMGGSATLPTVLLENQASTAGPAITLLGAGSTAAGDDPATAYRWRWSADQLQARRVGEAGDRLIFDGVNGRVYIGNGVAAPTGYLGGTGSTLFVAGLPLSPLTDNALDLGLSSLRWRDLRLGRGIGAYGTAPPAVKPTVSGSRGGNAALASLLTALVSFGLITDSSTA